MPSTRHVTTRSATTRRPAVRRLLAGVTATAALCAALPAASAAAASAPAAEPLDYVAMGDSFSAGSGIMPTDPDASPLCARTTKNYPHLLAARTGANLTDVTCGGATTEHFTAAQYPGVAPQLEALKADTDVVTLTIGGNDNSTFLSAIVACGTAGLATGGFGSPCKTLYGSKFTDTVKEKTYPAVKKTLEAIHARSPKAKVAIIGYPALLPAKFDRGCFWKMPVAEGDVPYLNDLQDELNGAVARAASETGTTYVDMAKASEGRDACAPADTRWIEPVLSGTNFVPVHPNAAGEVGMADRAGAELGMS